MLPIRAPSSCSVRARKGHARPEIPAARAWRHSSRRLPPAAFGGTLPQTGGVGTYGVALVAGILTALSPCVLPLVPVLMGSAVAAHRWGPWALAAGVALSFTIAGVFLASVGASLGLEGESFRRTGALLLILFGLILVSTR